MASLIPPTAPEFLAGERDEVGRQDTITRVLPNDVRLYGSLWVTNYRIVFKCTENDVSREYDPSVRDFDVPLASIRTVRKYKPGDAGGGSKVKSYLRIVSMDYQSYSLSFPMNSGGNKRTREAIERYLNSMQSVSISFVTMSKENWEPMFLKQEGCWVSGLPSTDLERKGITSGTSREFRESEINSKYRVSMAYPTTLAIPNSAADSQIEACAAQREAGQFPVVCWRSTTGGMLLMRALQQTSTTPSDEDLVVVRLMMLKCPNKLLRIFDVGSKRTLTYNKSYSQFFPEHLDLPSPASIESVFTGILDAFVAMNSAGQTSSSGVGLGTSSTASASSMKDAHMAMINHSLQAEWTLILAKYMEQLFSFSKLVDSGSSLLIQGSRKYMTHVAMITLLQVILDPAYRTLAGLCILLEKEWISFAFPFKEHTMARDKGTVPVFELTIHILWMLVQYFPTRFEYGEKVLAFILDHLFSSRFITFTVNNRKEWERNRMGGGMGVDLSPFPHATVLWAYIQTHEDDFKSTAFDPSTVPPEFWPLDSDSIPLGQSMAQAQVNPTSSNAGVVLLPGQSPHMLNIEPLVTGPMIWRDRFMRFDFTVRMDFVKASALAKPGFGGNSIYSLAASFRSLSQVPPKVLSLPGLTMLHLKNASLTHLPIEIAQATALEDFSVAGNALIRQLPEEWVVHIGKHLKKLRNVDFDKTGIGYVTLSLHKHIPSLQQLKLGHLDILAPSHPASGPTFPGGSASLNDGLKISSAVPPWPQDAKLESLELPNNGLTMVPPRLVNLVNITNVDLSGNRFPNIPLQLEYFTRLNKLNFADNLMPVIVPPPGGFRMESLTSLNLAGNGLETFPDHVGGFVALKSLSLARNKLSDMSARFFMQFKFLDILDLSNNRLTTLPTSVGNMIKLTYFDLSVNSINILPDSVIGMTSLKYLDLSYNKLPSLAVCFGRMKTLTALKIGYNPMTVLPPQLGSLRDSLVTFDFTGNELVTPPLDIVRGGSRAVLDFLFDSLSGTKPIYRMKLMIVGEENVGKTTLVDQLTRRWKAASIDGIYEPISTLSTDGIAISACSFHWKNDGDKKIARLPEDFDVNISWWDFAGQELYYTTHQFFLSGRSIFVVVWNLEKPMEDSRVEFWLNSIQSKISNATVVLVGTHLDGLKGPARDGLPELLKQTKLRLRMLFPSLDIMFLTASARTGEGMTELKEAMEKKIVSSKHMGEQMPSSYLLLEKMVMDARLLNAIPIVSKHKFLEMSLMCNISGEKELFRASNFLHNLGTLIYFEQDLVLSRYVILDPQWLAKLMSTLITTKHSFVTAGVIPHRALGQLWREFPLAMYGFLLGLLEKFEVTYDLSGFIDAATLGTTGPLKLIPLVERESTEAKKKGSVSKKKNVSLSNGPAVPAAHREWLQALIPMIKRHPNVVLGNSALRRLGHAQSKLTPASSPSNSNPSSTASSTPNSPAPSAKKEPRTGAARPTTISFSKTAFLTDSGTRTSLPGRSRTDSVDSSTSRTTSPGSSPNVASILEKGEAHGTFDIDGVSLIPSLLPMNPPAHFESKNMWPDVPATGETEVSRDYLLDFAPEGLFSRLTVRLLQRFLDQTKEFVMWREGLLLVRPDCTIFAKILTRGEFKVLRIMCRGTSFLEVGRVFSAVLEANGILFKEWPRLRITQEVVCPHCRIAKIEPPTYFPLELLLDAVRDDLNHVVCSLTYTNADGTSRTEEIPILLEKVAPDFRLVYLKGTQIQYSDLVVEKQIGVGGFAIVYKGQYKGETIAIKQLTVGEQDDENPDAAGAAKQAEVAQEVAQDHLEKQKGEMEAISSEAYTKAFNEFRKEAFMLTDIDDPNCVRMTGVCLKPFCLVTEFVACGDLYSLCHKEPLRDISWDLRLRIALDMAKGMNFLHSLRPSVIHNDLKSPNVLLASLNPDAKVVAKISDFGLSMRMSKMYTRLVDNPVWIAPEIMRGQTYDTKADVYAYGVMLWEMLERRGYFVEVIFNSELERKVMAGERPGIYNDTLPEYEKLIRACWDNDPLRRPPFENVIDLLEQLITAYQQGTTKVGPSSEMSLPGAQRGRRQGAAAGAEKPAFIKAVGGSSTPIEKSSSVSSNASDQSLVEPEIEPPKPVEPVMEPISPRQEEKQPTPMTTKVRLNVGGSGIRKAPTRAELSAQQVQAKPEVKEEEPVPAPAPVEEPEPVVETKPRSPRRHAPPDQPLSSMDRLNLILGVKASPPPPASTNSPTPQSSPTQPAASQKIAITKTDTPQSSPSPAPSTSPTVQSLPKTALSPSPSSDQVSVQPSPALPASPAQATPVSSEPSPAPTSAASTPSQTPPVVTLTPEPEPARPKMTFLSRGSHRPMSINTAIKGSINNLLSSLQSLTNATEALNLDDGDDSSASAPSNQSVSGDLTPPNGAQTPAEPSKNSAHSTLSASAPAWPQPNASPAPTSSTTLTSSSSSVPTPATTPPAATGAAKLPLISGDDARLRLTELGEGLKTILKQVVSMSGCLRSQDLQAFQTAVLDAVKFLKIFRESALLPAGLRSFNNALNEKLALLRNSLKTLLSQVVSLLQVARSVLKQDGSGTNESFAASASSFVTSFKITSGVLDMINLDGVTVMEIEPVDLSS